MNARRQILSDRSGYFMLGLHPVETALESATAAVLCGSQPTLTPDRDQVGCMAGGWGKHLFCGRTGLSFRFVPFVVGCGRLMGNWSRLKGQRHSNCTSTGCCVVQYFRVVIGLKNHEILGSKNMNWIWSFFSIYSIAKIYLLSKNDCQQTIKNSLLVEIFKEMNSSTLKIGNFFMKKFHFPLCLSSETTFDTLHNGILPISGRRRNTYYSFRFTWVSLMMTLCVHFTLFSFCVCLCFFENHSLTIQLLHLFAWNCEVKLH